MAEKARRFIKTRFSGGFLTRNAKNPKNRGFLNVSVREKGLIPTVPHPPTQARTENLTPKPILGESGLETPLVFGPKISRFSRKVEKPGILGKKYVDCVIFGFAQNDPKNH